MKMHLTINELNELTELQQLLVKIINEITYIKKMLHQLATDDCSVDMLFRMHNETKCAEYRQLQDVQHIIDLPFHAPRQRKQQSSCNEQINFSFTPRSGIRILAVILQEKEVQRQELQKRADALVQNIVHSPTQFLHHDQA